jgi:aminopeptidase C
MRTGLLLFVLLLIACPMRAQDGQPTDTGYTFTAIRQLPVTAVKNQSRSGTCWSFSALGMIEAELLRTGKGEYDLSEMFVVHRSYADKAVKYVRLQGHGHFAGGGSFYDVLYAFKHYGIVPEEAMTGLQYGEAIHVHGELDAMLKACIEAVVKDPNRKLTPVWHTGFKEILNAYLGAVPERFVYNRREYTPQSFAASLGIRVEDYVSLTSFTHHPFYSRFALEIPDNWRWAESYNLPLDELMRIIDRSLEAGYTVAWGTDVSEKGFSRDGTAVVPDVNFSEMSGSDQARWLGLSQRERDAELYSGRRPDYEKVITQDVRQEAFDSLQTTDDHGMLIFGTATDQRGRKYYMVKNSWGETGKYKGIWYVSEAFVRYKTINILVHRDVLPQGIIN